MGLVRLIFELAVVPVADCFVDNVKGSVQGGVFGFYGEDVLFPWFQFCYCRRRGWRVCKIVSRSWIKTARVYSGSSPKFYATCVQSGQNQQKWALSADPVAKDSE